MLSFSTPRDTEPSNPQMAIMNQDYSLPLGCFFQVFGFRDTNITNRIVLVSVTPSGNKYNVYRQVGEETN